jgi:hypothetical protein
VKFWEKHDKVIDLAEEGPLSEAQELAVKLMMKEGELRYREYLISVFKRIDETLKESGEPKPKLSIESFIKFLEDEPIEVIK